MSAKLTQLFDTIVRAVGHELHAEDRPGRVRAFVGHEAVLDTTRGRLLFETGSPPRFYAPVEDYRQDVLRPSDRSTHCPYKGDASYWSIEVGDRTIENAIWTYREPKESLSWLGGYAALYPEKVDRWVEQDATV